MILGKFMPPHAGHLYLANFARNFVGRLSVVVCSLEREPIDGALRFRWMRELLPDCDVCHLTDDLPQEPAEHPDFWDLWRRALQQRLPQRLDFVFASETYGWKLADVLGARFIPVDLDRSIVPISGTAVRAAPLQYWRYLPHNVRPYYVRRVCVFGPESTGKSTLARNLAAHYDTVWVSEFARGLLDSKQGRCAPDDIPLIARGQMAAEEALARQANRLLICDTDLLTTTIWSKVLFDSCPQWIEREADRRQYDLYLLLDVDVPWVDDTQRYLPYQRSEFFARCESALQRGQRPYVIIRGGWEERFQRATAAIDALLARAP